MGWFSRYGHLVEDAQLVAVARIVEAVTGLDAGQVLARHSFVDDLGVDSLGMLEVLEGVRVRLGVVVHDEAAAQLVHVGDLLDYLDHHAPRA